MKKVMVGILVLIPVIILLIVAAVSTIVSVQAWIAVDDLIVTYRGTDEAADMLVIDYEGPQKEFDLGDYVDLTVLPTRANMYTLEWSIVGDVQCTDLAYAARYQQYLDSLENHEEDIVPVEPVVTFLSPIGEDGLSGSNGKLKVNSFCRFTVMVRAESVSRTFSVSFEGHVPNAILLTGAKDSLGVGESMRLKVTYDPLGSVVNNTSWASSDPSVVSVDANGTVSALSEGSAEITVSTLRDDDKVVTSNKFAITVFASVSKYGDRLTTSKRTVSPEELGLNVEDLLMEQSDGVTLDGDGKLVFTGENATLKTSKGDLNIDFCDEDAIEIDNAANYDLDSGYVLEVGPLKLDLGVRWQDRLKGGAPASIVWTSSNPHIASVDQNGTVTPLGNGVVTISAQLSAGASAAADRPTVRRGVSESIASIRLNVQQKLDSVLLRTDDASLQVGLARETVFASEKFADFAAGNMQRVPNSADILVRGEPKRADYATDSDFDEAVKAFYNSFNFEVIEGGQFAAFSDIATPNRLYFDSAALEGKGKQTLTIKVTAKFPKYETEEALKMTTAYVHIRCVYGVEAQNYEQVKAATVIQREYSEREGNFLPEKLGFESAPNPKDNKTVKVYDGVEIINNYAICLVGDVLYPEGMVIQYDDLIYLFGDFYGNGHMVWSQATLSDGLTSCYWDANLLTMGRGGLMISNATVRAHVLQDGTLTEDNIDYIKMSGINIETYGDGSSHNEEYKHLNNDRIEFCILENAFCAVRPVNANYTVDGSILRNCTSCAIYNSEGVEDHTDAIYLRHTEATLNNLIASNNMGTSFGFSYQRVTLKDDQSPRFGATKAESEQWYQQNVADKGYAGKIIQTGFLDIYNWMNVNGAKLIRTGSSEVDNVIATLGGDMLKYCDAFDDARYMYNDEYYYHLGFFISGISTGQGIFDEAIYLETTFEDDRFICKYARDLVDENGEPRVPSGSQYAGARVAARLLGNMSIWLYGYNNQSTLTPASSYTVNAKLINHLHGEE